jgi:hypothetical protein
MKARLEWLLKSGRLALDRPDLEAVGIAFSLGEFATNFRHLRERQGEKQAKFAFEAGRARAFVLQECLSGVSHYSNTIAFK